MKNRRIYISLPVSVEDEEVQRERASELKKRVKAKGYEAVTPYDVMDRLDGEYGRGEREKPTFYDYVSADICELLKCDGIVMDADNAKSYACAIEHSVAKTMSASKMKRFIIFHTAEQWNDIKNKYIV